VIEEKGDYTRKSKKASFNLGGESLPKTIIYHFFSLDIFFSNFFQEGKFQLGWVVNPYQKQISNYFPFFLS